MSSSFQHKLPVEFLHFHTPFTHSSIHPVIHSSTLSSRFAISILPLSHFSLLPRPPPLQNKSIYPKTMLHWMQIGIVTWPIQFGNSYNSNEIHNMEFVQFCFAVLLFCCFHLVLHIQNSKLKLNSRTDQKIKLQKYNHDRFTDGILNSTKAKTLDVEESFDSKAFHPKPAVSHQLINETAHIEFHLARSAIN